jgi:hypothetical protein
LTVENTGVIAASFNGGSAATYVRWSDATDNWFIGTNNGLGGMLFKNETADANRFFIGSNGDVLFYEDTGTTPKMTWSSSAESLGLNITTPEGLIHLRGDGTTAGGLVFDSAAQRGYLYQDGTETKFQIGSVSGHWTWTNSGGERARIDSSGNLLVGTTDSASTRASATSGSGHVIQGGSSVVFTRQSASSVQPVAIFNDTGFDGDIVQFNKDGTTVGSIGTTSAGNFAFYSPSEGGLETAAVGILPMMDGVRSDNETDLGFSSSRFKDLYLSGGVYLGGTGSANKLDDYEEGVWTPAANGLTLNYSNVSASGKYTKIGRTVYVTGTITWDTANAGSGASYLVGLPFTPNAISGGQVVTIAKGSGGSVAYDQVLPYVVPSNTGVYFRVRNNGSRFNAAAKNDMWAGIGNTLDFSLTYTTDS